MAIGNLPQISNPAGYVIQHGMAFDDGGGHAVAVTAGAPLPVELKAGTATSTPLTGTASAAATVGPFTPNLARPIWLTFSGNWTGSAQLLRSTDGGATRLPLTYSDGSLKAVWTGNANVPAVEESDAAASYYLAMTIASGTLTYRVAQ